MANWIERFLAAITTHKSDASAHHAKYTDAEAQATVKANVEVGDLKAPTKALAMNSQKITGLAAPAAQNDAIRADANLRAPDSSKLEGSTKAQVQDHNPKAHTLASHSTKAHGELTGVGASDHHAKYTNAEAVAAAEAAGLALASGKNIKLIQALTGDHSWSGITAVMTAGENLAIGDAVYAKSDGKMWKADADAAGTMPVVALATASISADATGEFLLLGFMRDDTWNWTLGGLLYGHTTPGNPTQTRPSGAGDQVQVIGIAITADILLFNPSYELVEIS